jgi:HK97 family phage major capsid protein
VDSRSGANFALATAAAMLKAIESGNADSSAAVWIVDPASAELLRKREKAAGSGFLIADEKMLGLRVLVSNSVSAGYIFLGDFRECVLAVRSVEVTRNPFSQAKSGFVEIGAYTVLDVMLRHAACFSVATGTT